MKAQRVCKSSAWGFDARNRNTNPKRGTIPTRELPCSSKTGYGNNNPPQSNRALSIFLEGVTRRCSFSAFKGFLLVFKGAFPVIRKKRRVHIKKTIWEGGGNYGKSHD